MKLFSILPPITCIALLAPAAVATDRFYPDSFAVSPNGRYRIDAKSPENAGAFPGPFAENFTYTLTDTTTKKTLWQRKQPMTRSKGQSRGHSGEGSPIQVFVNDDGLVVARLDGDTLLFLEPADGRERGVAAVLNAFPRTQQDQFVSQTTAGPRWSGDSDWFFLSVPAADNKPLTTYFVIRPYWNHRLIVDVATANHVDLGTHASDSSPDQSATAGPRINRILTCSIAEEKRRALSALAISPELLASEKDYRAYRELSTAFHTIGFLKIADAEPGLRALERSLENPHEQLSGLRPKLRQALRSIGKTPAPGYGVDLYPSIKEEHYFTRDTKHPYRTTVPPEQRIVNAAKISVGMSAKEFTDLIGCPDAELYYGDHAYDYDIDAPTPYTLRVFIDRNLQTIQSIKTITPFAFLHDPARQSRY